MKNRDYSLYITRVNFAIKKYVDKKMKSTHEWNLLLSDVIYMRAIYAEN